MDRLYKIMESATSEEDVKNIWTKFLGLKDYKMGRVDLSTKDTWFEFKYNRKEENIVNIAFAELYNYVITAIKNGEELPKFLVVANRYLFVIVEMNKIIDNLKHNKMDWSFTPSKPSMEAIDFVEHKTSMYFRMFNVEKEEVYLREYYDNAIKNGVIIKTDITINNIQDVYKMWYDCIGQYIIDLNKKTKLSKIQLNYIPKNKDYRDISNIFISLFYADIFRTDFSQHDIDNKDTAIITYSNNAIPYFILNNKQYTIGSIKNYNIFQNKYNIPTDTSIRKEIYERADLLIEDDVKKYIGAFYTPIRLAKKSIEYLQRHYDLNDYIIWDMAAGTGNLEMYLSNKTNVFLSTLNGSDVDTMKRSGYFINDNVFQYDYLNDDIDALGNIDYNITKKVPQPLRDAIRDGKKILVYINPPYAEATSINEKNKEDVANTIFSGYIKEYGKASNELFTQFMIRVEREMPTAVLGIYSTLKYVNAPNFVDFRNHYKATFIDGFVFQANNFFEGVKGSFPIGFLIWDLKDVKIGDIKVDVLDNDLNNSGKNSFYTDTNYLTKWIKRPKSNDVTIPPLKNACSMSDKICVDKWSDNALGYIYCNSNDLQSAGQKTALFSSVFGSGHGFYVNKENIEKAYITFAIRMMIKHTWLNHNDQFIIPNKELSEEFKNDCLIYMLFNGKNLSSSKLNYNGKDYTIINHFVPFCQKDVNAKEPFKSSFIYDYMKDKTFSKETLDVLEEGKKIWTKFFEIYDTIPIDTMIDKQLSNNAGWYQIRKTLEDMYGKGFDKSFKDAYKRLEDKMIPQVYEYGFLR